MAATIRDDLSLSGCTALMDFLRRYRVGVVVAVLLVTAGAFAAEEDGAFAQRLLTEAGVATIPLSPFYERPQPLTFVRLCIAKQDATLDQAAERLNALAWRLRRGA